MRLFSFVLILLLSVTLSAEKKVLRIDYIKNKEFTKILKGNFDILAVKPDKYIDIAGDEKVKSELESLGYSVSVAKTESEVKEDLVKSKDIAGYRDYQTFLTELQELEENYPGLVKLYDIGDSKGKEYFASGNNAYSDYNHDIWAIKLSDNVAENEDEPGVFYLGEHHAREPISLEVSMHILNYLLENYDENVEITELIDNTQIWFVPLVNPDGHKIVLDQNDVWWRKNIHDNNENGTLDLDSHIDGVDPNRNYGYKWGNVGASSQFEDDTYHGTEPFSEPEIKAIKELVESNYFQAGISYHSYSELVLYPYGYAYNVPTPDHLALKELAEEMAATIPQIDDTGYYTPQISSELYPAMGVTDDWAYGEHSIFSYTIELAQEFIPSADQIPEICDDNLEAALILLRRVHRQLITGIVKDKETGLPLQAEIFIEGVDDTGASKEPYLANEQFGRYHRMLKPGNHTVRVKAYGYKEAVYNNISVTENNITELNAELEPAGFYQITGKVVQSNGSTPISEAVIEVIGTPVENIISDSNGNFSIPEIAEGTYKLKITALDYSTVIEDFTVSENSDLGTFSLELFTGDDFESGEISANWVLGGDADWNCIGNNAYDGDYSAYSGNLDDGQNSSIMLEKIVTNGNISFAAKVSSEEDYDFFNFYIDGTAKLSLSGESGWQEYSFPVTSGLHSFKWEYAKDGYVSEGSDCSWLDNVIFPGTTGVNENHLDKQVRLHNNYPNPFNPSTNISFVLNSEMQVNLAVFNAFGQLVNQLSNKKLKAGKYQFKFDAADLNSGVYFYRLKAGNKIYTKKMILLK